MAVVHDLDKAKKGRRRGNSDSKEQPQTAEPVVITFVDRARHFINKACSINEAKEVADKAQAMRLYCKRRGQSLELQNQCAELTLRAERRVGELLAEIDRSQGGRPAKNSLPVETSLQDTMTELGIAGKTAFHWQKVATIPEADFEHEIARIKDEGKEITTVGMLGFARKLQRKGPFQAKSEIESPVKKLWVPVHDMYQTYCYLEDRLSEGDRLQLAALTRHWEIQVWQDQVSYAQRQKEAKQEVELYILSKKGQRKTVSTQADRAYRCLADAFGDGRTIEKASNDKADIIQFYRQQATKLKEMHNWCATIKDRCERRAEELEKGMPCNTRNSY